MLTDDCQLTRSDVQGLSSADQVASFFLSLGYNVDARVQQTSTALGIGADSLARRITHIERIANQDEELQVYLFQMKSMRVADRQALARHFGNLSGEFLLILTSDYDTLDFVLLERALPPSRNGGMGRKRVAVHPHVLTVDRQNPDAVSLRVLRRFSYTEADAQFQFEKLLSAYTVAEWSEPLFNNRALFSDYYLNQRLRESDEWQENPQPIYRALRSLLLDARPRLAGEDEATTRGNLLEPAFGALGFAWRGCDGCADGAGIPDYRLLGRDATEDDSPLALCLAYKWNRYLDGRDETRDNDRRDHNPGARVVSVLESGQAPYVIVTNGKLWRLYAARAHSRATNYYEVDLEEALSSPDREEAIRYFWLLFRGEAFVPRPVVREGEIRSLCFLDQLVEDSETYAKELGKRLKDRVFDEIFPHLAEGFIECIRREEGRDVELEQNRLDGIYQGTLTFLYRMMFVLYAESRDLLPVKDQRGYWEVSLSKLKGEIARDAGDIVDAAPGRLRRAYGADSTILYERLRKLFTVIDEGNPDLNVPRYNGGLFLTAPADDDVSPEAANARFLCGAKIPDRYMALGLDLLARDVDAKTQALVMIDFKSLGVRQLGSIYEGLLEFKLRIARERMAIVKGKRTEEIIPYREAKKKKRKILTEGRGENRRERTLAKGAVYLDNTRQERKATGSYYTPDYIVKYIVQHTVRPVLEEKLASQRPRLREVERRYRTHRQNAKAKSKLGRYEDPEKFWNNEAVQELAYDVLDIKVLDPAMGSGHFLVETVDFITDHLLHFLNGFPDNPVRASLDRTRRAILEAMEDQGVSIDPDRLNDVALLKRQVLKRCVYGVDLNPMAVELAKVSLWLDAFTLGAPLSFLDHHLRYGNSLIGAMARDADRELRGETAGQATLWGGPFEDLLRQAEIMLGIGRLADATMEQVHESANLFRLFEEAAKPYKQLLDVFVMRQFGTERAGEFLRLYGAEVMSADVAKLARPYREVLAERQRLYEKHRFFHWDLEFPEVFIDLKNRRWREDAGFHAVAGNPPYVRVRTLKEMKDPCLPYYLSGKYACAVHVWDLYLLFSERALSLARPRGRCSFIMPVQTLHQPNCLSLRRLLVSRGVLYEILDLGRLDVFDEAIVKTAILVFGPGAEDSRPEHLLLRDPSDEDLESAGANRIPYGRLWSTEEYSFKPELLLFGALTDKVEAVSEPLGRLLYVTFGLRSCAPGVGRGGKDRLILPSADRPSAKRYMEGREINRFETNWAGNYIDYQPQEMYSPREPSLFEREKIVARSMLSEMRLVATYDCAATYVEQSLVCMVPHDDSPSLSLKFILAVLNSRLASSHFSIRIIGESLGGGLIHATPGSLEKLPIRRIHFVTPADEAATLTAELIGHYEHKSFDALLAGVEALLPKDSGGGFLAFQEGATDVKERSDVVHDLLGWLAERMIRLNEQRQAEIKRFLEWLEGQIGAKILGLTGKTIIGGYLGDYQKGEGELAFGELLDRLHKNRSRIPANLSDPASEAGLRREYEASLAVLLPIKERLASTDRLIDQVVYRLYGLTEEEIAIVEGQV